mmetsp:Transcript_166192/g.533513  ORF Transcript_166192/g.533513 Transcript_166192/m.533513 type:complete len:320 (-) Transcript_166192:565-1524(-)
MCASAPHGTSSKRFANKLTPVVPHHGMGSMVVAREGLTSSELSGSRAPCALRRLGLARRDDDGEPRLPWGLPCDTMFFCSATACPNKARGAKGLSPSRSRSRKRTGNTKISSQIAGRPVLWSLIAPLGPCRPGNISGVPPSDERQRGSKAAVLGFFGGKSRARRWRWKVSVCANSSKNLANCGSDCACMKYSRWPMEKPSLTCPGLGPLLRCLFHFGLSNHFCTLPLLAMLASPGFCFRFLGAWQLNSGVGVVCSHRMYCCFVKEVSLTPPCVSRSHSSLKLASFIACPRKKRHNLPNRRASSPRDHDGANTFAPEVQC